MTQESSALVPYEGIQERVNELMDVFQPRDHWSNCSSALIPESRDLIFLAAARHAGELKLTSTPIELCESFPELNWMTPQEERELLCPAASRRGGLDLKLETWTAFKQLQTLHPDGPFESFYNGLPFGWLHRPSQTFVAAGNIDPDRMIDFMLAHDVRRLGSVGLNWVPSPRRNGSFWVDDDAPWSMKWLALEPRAFDLLRKQRAEEENRMMRSAAPLNDWLMNNPESPLFDLLLRPGSLEAASPNAQAPAHASPMAPSRRRRTT